MTFKTGNDWWKHQSAPIRRALTGAVIYDAYYDAILGTVTLQTATELPVTVLLYSTHKSIEELERDVRTCDPSDDNPWTTALEYWEFNVAGGWIGDRTPLLLNDMGTEDRYSNEYLRRCNPGFVGFATRCSDKTYAVFDTESLPGVLNVESAKDDISIPYNNMVTLRRIPDAKGMSRVRKQARR